MFKVGGNYSKSDFHNVTREGIHPFPSEYVHCIIVKLCVIEIIGDGK